MEPAICRLMKNNNVRLVLHSWCGRKLSLCPMYVCYHVCNIKLKRKPTRSGGKIWKDKHESFICKQSLPRVIIQLDGDNIFAKVKNRGRFMHWGLPAEIRIFRVALLFLFSRTPLFPWPCFVNKLKEFKSCADEVRRNIYSQWFKSIRSLVLRIVTDLWP